MKKILLLPCPKQRYVLSPNEQAFTLLEVLLALSIFTTIVFFIAPIFHMLVNNKDSQVRLQEMEWEVFCSQIKKEIHSSSRVEVIDSRLVLTNNKGTIFYEKYNNSLRRRVNSTGHEILLQNVAEVTFIRLNNTVKILVKDTWGKEYSVLVHAYIDWLVAI